MCYIYNNMVSINSAGKKPSLHGNLPNNPHMAPKTSEAEVTAMTINVISILPQRISAWAVHGLGAEHHRCSSALVDLAAPAFAFGYSRRLCEHAEVESAHHFDFGVHLGEHRLDHLERPDRLAEPVAVVGDYRHPSLAHAHLRLERGCLPS